MSSVPQLPSAVEFNRITLVTLLSVASDNQVIAYICTFAEGYKDSSICDMAKYRACLLRTSAEYEEQRAKLVNQEPTPVEAKVKQFFNAMRKGPYRHCYTHGIPINLPPVLPEVK